MKKTCRAEGLVGTSESCKLRRLVLLPIKAKPVEEGALLAVSCKLSAQFHRC